MNLKLVGNMRTADGKLLDSSSIELLIKSGLSAAVFDIEVGENALEHGCSEVLAAFVKLNSPVALILRTPSRRLSEAASWAGRFKFNYIWIEDTVEPEAVSALSLIPDIKIIVSVKDSSDTEKLLSLCPLCSAFFLPDVTENAEELRRAGKQIFVGESKNPPAFIDAMVFEHPSAQLLKSTSEDISADCRKSYLSSYLSSRQPSVKDDVIAYSTVFAAEKLSAKAIIAMTCETGPIDRLTSYYPTMPVIAVANRKLYERLLLSFCCNYGVLPTAITKIPEKPGEEAGFARFIAGLYGYQPGDTFVVTGSYHPGGPKDYLEIVTL